MIFYKPITENTILTDMFPDKHLKENRTYGGYIALENDINKGCILFEIDGYYVELLAISSVEDNLLIEGLIRSALNFAGNRNAYVAKCKLIQNKDVLTLLGFKEENGTYTGEIPELLKGTCCKG